MSKFLRSALRSAFCVALFAFVCAAEAAACSCAFGGGAVCQEFWNMDAVFAGTVTENKTVTVDEGSYKHQVRLFKFAVAETFRGEQSAQAEIATGRGGGDCGYGFRVGESYLVYARRNEKDGRLYTGICMRTKPLAGADEDLSYIRALPRADATATIFGTVGRRNHQLKEGEQWYKPVGAAQLVVEGPGGGRVEARTDAQGNFSVSGLAPGAYKVKVKLPPGLTYHKVAEDGTVEDEAKVFERGCAQVWFLFDTDTRVGGRVLDALGQPVANLKLEMRGAPSESERFNTFFNTQTNADGGFEFQQVPPGNYWLGVRLFSSSGGETTPYPRTYYPGVPSRATAAVISVREGEGVRDLELRLPPRLTEREVEGFVVWADGRPAPGVNIYLSLQEEGEITGSRSLRADERGRFKLKVYEGLKYSVSAYPQGATGAAPQSPWVEVPQTPGSAPIKLVLPILKR